MTLSSQLLWNYWSDFHETWYVDRTSCGAMHIGRKFWSPHFCGSYAPWNLESICKSTNNLSFLCNFFINEITASDAGPDIIRSHLFCTEGKQFEMGINSGVIAKLHWWLQNVTLLSYWTNVTPDLDTKHTSFFNLSHFYRS